MNISVLKSAVMLMSKLVKENYGFENQSKISTCNLSSSKMNDHLMIINNFQEF